MAVVFWYELFVYFCKTGFGNKVGFLRQLLFVTVLNWLWAVVARASERVAFIHWVRLVLDKLTNQKFGNYHPLRMVSQSHKNLSSGRDLSMTFFQCGPCPKKKSATDFANSFHATIKFTHEMSSDKIVFLETEVYKGPRFADNKNFGCSNSLQAYRNVSIYAFFFKPSSQC